jgi:putative peptidoglycan lipid II flippase
MSLIKIESFKKGIVLSTGFNLVAKLLLFLQTVVIVYLFGNNIKTDIFFFIFSTLLLITNFFNSLDYSVLIPESMRKFEQENETKSFKFLNFFIYLYVFLGGVLMLPLIIDPISGFSLLSNFEVENIQQNSSLLLSFLPLFLLMILVNFFANILTSFKYFTMPMIAGSINSVVCLLFVFLFHVKLGIISITLGLIISHFINLIFLTFIMVKKLNWNFFTLPSLPNKTIIKNIFFAQTGNFVSMLANYFPLYILSGFNAGIITALTLGQKTAEVPGNLLNTQFSSVVGIKMNEIYAKKEEYKLNDVYLESIKTLLFLIIPITSIMFFWADEIIIILFHRGEFDYDAAKTSALFLKLFALVIPLHSINSIVSRIFMAGQKIKESVWYQIAFNAIFLTSLFFLVKHYDAFGFPYALIGSSLLNLFLTYFLIKRYFSFIKYYKTLFYLFPILILNFLLTGSLSYFIEFFYLPVTIKIIIAGSANLIILMLINNLFKLNKQVYSLYSGIITRISTTLVK